MFVAHGFLDDREDIFYLHRTRSTPALYDLSIGWATGMQARGPSYWAPEVARRRRSEVLKCHGRRRRPSATRRSITEPLTVMLWGITQKSVEEVARVAGRRRRRTASCAAWRPRRASPGAPA